MRFALTMRRAAALFLPLLFAAVPTQARDSLGVFGQWGAFRDPTGPRCYAITQPVVRAGSRPRGFAAVGTWPRQKIRGQIHFRLSRPRRADAPVLLKVGDRRFTLVAGQMDAWAPDARTDAQVIAAMRSATGMSVATVGSDGRGFADSYTLRGAATAIDAAALGCARLR